MRWLVLLVCLSFAVAAHAASVSALADRVDEAQTAYTRLQNRIASVRQQQQAQLTQAFQAQTTLLQLADWPAPLITTSALLARRPAPQGLVAATGRQSATQLGQLASRLTTYTQLTEQAQTQLQDLTSLKSAYSGQTKRLSRLEKVALEDASRQAEELATTLTAALSESTTPAPLALPRIPAARLPVPGRVVFGFHQSGGETTHTEGLTFSAPPGSVVTALSTGQVLYAGPFRNLGGLVIVKTGRLHYVYAGLEEILPTPGSIVRQGSQLGRLPAEGRAARLYLEIRQSGRPIDPTPLLSRR